MLRNNVKISDLIRADVFKLVLPESNGKLAEKRCCVGFSSV